jgi:hypothetical protein
VKMGFGMAWVDGFVSFVCTSDTHTWCSSVGAVGYGMGWLFSLLSFFLRYFLLDASSCVYYTRIFLYALARSL